MKYRATHQKEDPFFERGLADFRIIEFRASQRADDIQRLIEKQGVNK